MGPDNGHAAAVRPFADVLSEVNKGVVADEAATQLAELVTAVQQTGRKGTLNGGTVQAVLDAHLGAGDFPARWQEHRLVLKLQQTGPWREWTTRDGMLMPQADFAEFIEDHARDVIAPAPKAVSSADLLEIAQSFHAHTSVEFKRGHRVQNGQTQFEFTETVQASAKVERGTIEIPNEFSLGIRPFDDCDPMVIRARFRYRINGGDLMLGFRLDDARGTARDAVKDVVAKLAEACGVTVMHGRPA